MPSAAPLSERLPTIEEAEKAGKAVAALARQAGKKGALRLHLTREKRNAPVELPPAVSQLVLDLLVLISRREAVTLVPVGTDLSTQQAADLLNVSRPFLVKLLDAGDIPSFKVGTHRRIRSEEFFAYKHARDRTRGDALARLTRLGQEIDAE